MNKNVNTSPLKAWLLAIRPKTLPAAIAPVMVGMAMAITDNAFKPLPVLAAMSGALLLQVGVNLANDYFDYIKGVDTADRLGPVRATQSGMISPKNIKTGMMVVFGLSLVVGIYLTVQGGWPIIIIGLASIAAAFAYSGGPYPLASHGLGDITVFVFFGLTAVCGTYYVQTLKLGTSVILVSVPIGLLITAILVVNNLRDIHTDQKTKKRTLAVILGERGTKAEYTILIVIAYCCPAILFLTIHKSAWIMLPLISLYPAIKMVKKIYRVEGTALNSALAQTAQLTFIFSILLSIGLILYD